uniref:Elongation factor Tu GTP binding domain protein n=1 Tax=Pithovirus LCPAC101 TaxID=2506586 RepID=A0A481Z469_9VIRU|nr:MAG: elongation factor Tu GTP binding domain protein [Pithovirus LCPAC101]
MNNRPVTIALVGEVDSGKSSLIGVLSSGISDDGNGKSRSTLLTMKHEREKGRTSSIHTVITNINGTLVRFLDLAGHEKYIHTTLSGLTKYYPDYALLLIGGQRGVTPMTIEHIRICVSLELPVIICITKMDITPVDVLNNTITMTKRLCKQARIKFQYIIHNEDTMIRCIKAFDMYKKNVCPIIKISNITGYGLDHLKIFISKLKYNKNNDRILNEFMIDNKINYLFTIYKPYYVRGIGIVLYGLNRGNDIKTGDVLKIGPIYGKYHNVKIRSIHDKDRNDSYILPNNSIGCLAIRCLDKNIKLTKRIMKKGQVIIDTPIIVTGLIVKVQLFNQSITIRRNYNSYIYCCNMATSSKIIDIANNKGEKVDLIRTNDYAEITFELYTSQFIYPGEKLLLRDGKIRGVGIIKNIISK